MKRICLFIVFQVVVFSGNVHPSGFGLKAGFKYNTVTGSSGYRIKSGYCFGIYKEMTVTRAIRIQPEILYNTGGADKYGDFPSFMAYRGAVLDPSCDFHYIDLPVSFKYHFNNDKIDNLNIYFGPVISFLLAAYWQNHEDDHHDQKYDIKNDVNKTGYGLCFGFDFTFILFDMDLLLDARYQFGLNRIYMPSDWDYERIQHASLALSLGLHIM